MRRDKHLRLSFGSADLYMCMSFHTLFIHQSRNFNTKLQKDVRTARTFVQEHLLSWDGSSVFQACNRTLFSTLSPAVVCPKELSILRRLRKSDLIWNEAQPGLLRGPGIMEAMHKSWAIKRTLPRSCMDPMN